MSLAVAVSFASLVVAASPGAPAPAAPGYHVASTIKLGAGDERWDYITFDDKGRRLFVSRSSHVSVVDVDTQKVIGDIADTDGVHGIALAPDLGRGFTSNGKAGTITVFDTKTLKRISDVKSGGENPDAIIYDAATKLVFAMNGKGKSVTALDAATATVKATVEIGGKPEFAVVDGAKLFVNVEDKNQIAVIDTAKLKVTTRIALPECDEPGGLALDASTHRLFVGCGNSLMLIVNDANGKIVATLPTGDGTDACAFDAKSGYAFASNGAGTLTVVHEDSADKFQVVENAKTEPGARTMALAPDGTIYLPTADLTPSPEHKRPSIVQDTFRILVVRR